MDRSTANNPALPPSEPSRVCPHCSQALGPADSRFCPSCGRILVTSPRRRFWIRTAIVSGVVCTLVAFGLLYQAIKNPQSLSGHFGQQRDPVYQWVESDVRSFDFMPGEGKAWGPVDPQQGEIRYSIRANMPVDIGLMDSKWADRMDAWGYMRTSGTCFESKVRKSAQACKLTKAKPQLIFVRDLRPKQAGLGLAHEFGTRAAIQEPNSVIITILTRKCMENCKFALD